MKISRKALRLIGALLALSVISVACGGADASTSGSKSDSASGPLTGAGSTLVAPLMSKWESDYASKTGNTVTYGAIGSGGGIEQITQRT
ncbi:MAG: phosphate transport system substrate-binding protein, partial [Actinomycetota bacterium]|nr:phosphate transport system substrate-binding protein [Actinomycetota bacterium]